MTIVYAFFASLGFALLFEIKDYRLVIVSALEGAIGWACYLALSRCCSSYIAVFFATITISALAEVFARLLKSPATLFLVVGIIPLVPGADIYYTMRHLIAGNMGAFGQSMLKTMIVAGAIAVGCSMVTAVMRIHRSMKRMRKAKP